MHRTGLRELGLRALAALILAWCVVAAVSGFLAARAGPRDPWGIVELEVEFRALTPYLPAFGTIGYLEAYADAGSDGAVRTHYAAQYALAPLVVDRHTNHEFLIVARGTARPDGDPRLEGFVPVATAPGGHRLYRRFP